MRILSVGGGPAGLYFALLMKKSDPSRSVTVVERNRPGETFGFGVVFSDATMENLAAADPESHAEITRSFAHWGDIDVHFGGQVLRSVGHGFAGMSRRRLLDILERRCLALGVELRFGEEVAPATLASRGADPIVAADGVNSAIRTHLAASFRPSVDERPNRFVWLGTSFPFEAFTFLFKEDRHGLWRVHAYRYADQESTFIVECTEATWRAAGLDGADEDATIAYLERLFADELGGHRLLKNRSLWRSFPIIRNERWHHENVVLVGDAAHTAHFSIGSGTKLALEDAIALHRAVDPGGSIPAALEAYERERRPAVESTQRAAQVSLEWFENTERYTRLEPLQFTTSLLTRSLRVTHENLKLRDPALVRRADGWFAEKAAAQSGVARVAPGGDAAVPPPPMFTPFRLRELVLENRVVVSPMCMYRAKEGVVGDWHLVHLGSRAVGGAGLLIAEMTAVSPEARITPGCAGIWTDEQAAAWRRVVDFVHAESGAKIGLQLGHAGRKGSTRLPWEAGGDRPLPAGGWDLVAPSPVPYLPDSPVPREMSRGDMEQTIADYVAAARRADAAGFDLLELHAAHGYLLASFLSPLTNRRTDGYGGDVAGRLRFPLEIFDALRAAWPTHKPLSVRVSATDWTPGGLSEEDLSTIARAFRDHGCDILDVSAGQTVPEQRPRYGRLFQTPFSDRVRLEVGMPTMTVGAISTWEDVNSILLAGRADLVVLARAHLFDPYFSRHAAEEQGLTTSWPEPYAVMTKYKPRPGRKD